jgi:U3 small nucleolar RNA-associated protein 25
LIIDNADLLMMQNWEHVLEVFDHLHLQPKKSHDVDFSRVRNWLLDGNAKYHRQTLVFSRIPSPSINAVFNKFCHNFAGKVQLNLKDHPKMLVGTICRIGFQLTQVFHRIECDSPSQLPNCRFQFFIEKVVDHFKI